MKTVADYVQMVLESEGAINTISSGAVETTPTPGKVQKRKTDESATYEGQNPLADNIGKIPLANANLGTERGEQENPLADNVGKAPLTGVQAPDVSDAEVNQNHMFKQKQAAQTNYS